jgi:Ca2+/Na+ antiporter
MMQKAKYFFEVFLLIFLSLVMIVFFLVSTPISKDPHGFLVMNELSDFSNNSLIKLALFGSAAVCVGLGALLMSWIPTITSGMISNLFSTTYFLLWVDSVFGLSLQFQTLTFLVCFGTGLIFIYFFFFTIGYVDLRDENKNEAHWKEKLVHYWLGGWMCFHFLISMLLILKSAKYSETQVPLGVGFFGLCFLNYLLLLFLKKKTESENGIFSRMGRVFFSLWFSVIVVIGIAQVWRR